MTAPTRADIEQYIHGKVKTAGPEDREGWQPIHCPNTGNHKHGDRDASAAININSGYFECHACGLKGVIGKIYSELGWTTPPWNGHDAGASHEKSTLPAWHRIWDESIPADSEKANPLRLYLKNRGITLPKIPEDVRFHPGLAYFAEHGAPTEKLGDYPAMICLARDKDQRPTGIQRIWLTTDGRKAPVEKPKKALGIISGSAVYFDRHNGSLNATEGIETGLAVLAATGLPTCAAISAPGLSNLSLPDGLHTIDIWADKDPSEIGERAGLELARRAHAAGLTVYLRLPYGSIPNGAKGIDWLDVYNQGGPEALQMAIERGEPWKPPSRFKIGIAANALKPQPPIDWLFSDFLARKWVSIWYGEPGCKKTFAIIDQAVCVASGKPWLGYPVTRSTVLLVDEESGEQRLLRRLGDTMRGHGVLDNIPLHYVSLHGFNLTEEKGAAELEELVMEVKPGLVIVDALADLMLGGDENLVRDTQPVLVRFRRIAERQDCAIEVIHHVNKAGEYRGSTALKGAVDTMILVESRPDSPLVTFSAEKTRDVIIRPFSATAHFNLGTFHLSEADTQAAQTKLSPGERYVLHFLEKNGPSTIRAIMDHADTCSEETARRAVYNLAARTIPLVRRVDEGGKGKEATYELVRNI